MAELAQVMQWGCPCCCRKNITLQFSPVDAGVMKNLRCDGCGSISRQSFFLGAVRHAKPTKMEIQ
jgi:hypothetical protein